MPAAARVLPSRSLAPALLRVGDRLAGKYLVESVLGEGGMGVVVAAYHELLDQRVAVKLLYEDVADQEAIERLLFEARASAKIVSDHVVRVLDVDTGPGGLPFIVMELLEGQDLSAVLEHAGPMHPALVVDYVLQALDGLAHAHARGLVHRDLKPSNLFLARTPDGGGVVKVLDFGISKATAALGPDARRNAQLTGGASVLGSPPYMSPEQIRAPKTVDARSDVWAVGVVVYELLTGMIPFGGDEMQETFAQILERAPVAVAKLAPATPPGLAAVVMRCLEKDRARRPQNVAELAAALAPFGSGAFAPLVHGVAATLARGTPEDSSGPRLPAAPVAIPSSPARGGGGLTLHGTASTLGRFRAENPMLWVAILAPIVVVVGLASVFIVVSRRRAPAPPEDTTVLVPVPMAATEPSPPAELPPAETSDLGELPLPAPTASTTAAHHVPSPRAVPSSPRKRSALPAGLPNTRR